MGRAKESLQLGETSLLERATQMLLQCTTPVVIVARDADQQLPPMPDGTETILDHEPDGGPLAAMRTGLCWLRDRHGFAPDDAAFVTGCDLPFLDRSLVLLLQSRLGMAPIVMAKANGLLQPLVAIYRLVALPDVDQLLASGVRTPRTLAQLTGALIVNEGELRQLDPELNQLLNVNTPADYQQAIDRHRATKGNS